MTNFSQRHQESQLLQSCYSLRSVWWLWLNTVCKCFVVWLKSTHRPSEEVCRVSASKTAPVLCSDYFHLSKHHFREECGSEVGTHSLTAHVMRRELLSADKFSKVTVPWSGFQLDVICKSTISMSTLLGKANTCRNLADTWSLSTGWNECSNTFHAV